MIIGLTGLKGSGKDTVGAYLVKQHKFERRSFADPLKRSFAALFDIPLWEIENFKNDDTVFVTVGNKNEPTTFYPAGMTEGVDIGEPNHMWSPIREQTFRSALQRYGTEAHRDVFGKDFWVDEILPKEGFYIGKNIVITDCRFRNEAQRITSCGGFVVRVERPDSDTTDSHASEQEQQEITPHYILNNTGTIDSLYNEVEKMLDRLMDDGA